VTKYLITGSSGFVGKNFLEYLNDNTISTSVLGIDIAEPAYNSEEYTNLKFKFVRTDLRDRDKVSKIIYDFNPKYILHLASYSSVAGSWRNPNNCFQNNVNIFLNLLEDIRKTGIDCRIISVGSSDVYGIVKFSELPIREEQCLNPLSPFGIARQSQELLSQLYSNIYGMDIVITRSFNHIGPGQSENFAISSFAKQITDLKRNNGNEFIVTGDVSVVRDFIDVRDVVRAYHQLFLKGKRGEIYNVCSGCGISLHNIIQMLCEIMDIRFSIREDKKLRRPADIPVIVGCNDKLKKQTSWTNEIMLEESLRDILKFYLIRDDNVKKTVYRN
jgi:GDP-4-dehydro-6-deoxy-D-mannose reductase